MVINVKCLICSKKTDLIICKNCSLDPLKIEDARRVLAQNKDYKKLLSLYNSTFMELSDRNTKLFWDPKLENISSLKDQDSMTKARIYGVLSLLPQRTQKILDIGAGYGFIEEVFHNKKLKFKLFGFDISPQAVKNLNERFQGDFRVGSVYKIPFNGLKFDAVLALEVFEHIPPSKIFSVIKSIKQNISPNGVLIVSVPVNENLDTMGDNPSGHLREYSLDLLKAELEISGLKVDIYKEFSAFKRFYKIKALFKRYILRNRWVSNDILVRAVKI